MAERAAAFEIDSFLPPSKSSDDHDPAESPSGSDQLQAPNTPWWAWLLLIAAVFAVSSAGVVFSFMKDVPPLTLAAWRLQLTSVYLIAGAAWQYARMPPEHKLQLLQSVSMSIALIITAPPRGKGRAPARPPARLPARPPARPPACSPADPNPAFPLVPLHTCFPAVVIQSHACPLPYLPRLAS
jgi:hypothetical protein